MLLLTERQNGEAWKTPKREAFSENWRELDRKLFSLSSPLKS
jgi:hypothetical protein